MAHLASVPNLLTLLRLATLPGVILLFRHGYAAAAAGMFVAAMVTDVLDGWLAKRLDQRSVFGLYLDPVVDKIVLLSLFYELAHARLIDWAVPHLFLARELLQNAVRAVAAGSGTVVGANWMGKTKALLQAVVITWGLILPAVPLGANAVHSLGDALRGATWAVLVVSWCFFGVFMYWNRRLLEPRGSSGLR